MTEVRPDRRPVAAFDFDGTIARRDTLVPFLGRVAGRASLARAMVARAPQLAGMMAGRVDRDIEKEHLIARLLTGRVATDVDAAGVRYAEELWSRARFRPEMIERLAWHRDQGHEIVIVSASLDVYLRPLAARLDVDEVLSCSLAVDDAGILTGGLAGGNVRGPEKVRRLQAWLAEETPGSVELWAYGDSAGDEDLLALADHPVRVGR